VHLPYGSTRVFLTIEPQELVCVKEPEPASWTSLAPRRGLDCVERLRRVLIHLDFRLALDRGRASGALESIKAHLSKDCSVFVEPLGPRSMSSHLEEFVAKWSNIPSQAQDSAEMVLSVATCHPFVDLLGSLGGLAYPNGGTDLVECLEQHVSGNGQRATALLLEPFRGRDTGPLLALMGAGSSEGELSLLDVSTDVSRIQELSAQTGADSVPESMTALVGSLGGEPNDSMPSAGIPYLLSLLTTWRPEVSGFVAMWDRSLYDLPLFAAAHLSQDELRKRLESRFDWHEVVLYMIRSAGPDERIRVVTSMPPILVAKILGWRVQETGAELLRSLKRATKGELKLGVIRDVTMAFPARSKSRETKQEN